METNPYNPPKSRARQPVTKNGRIDESTARLWKFEDSSWGIGLKFYGRAIWSIIIVNTIVAVIILSTASDCQMIVPPTNAVCEIGGINFAYYVTYSAAFLIPVVFGLLVVNWLIRQVMLFVFAVRN
jgi:hypothetical protein